MVKSRVSHAEYWNFLEETRSLDTLYSIRRGRERKRQAVEYLGGECTICGIVVPDCAFDFHHKNPEEKDHNPRDSLSLSWENCKKELDKCVLLCANCHRVHHWGEKLFHEEYT